MEVEDEWCEAHHGLGDEDTSWCGEMHELPLDAALTPRVKRVLAQPLRLEHSAEVLCHTYPQARDGGAQWQGHVARLCYFLPEHWSPSYKFTVFEDSYVVQFAAATSSEGAAAAPAQFHLARPLRTALGASGAQPEFELVWPVPLDVTLMDAVRSACDRVQPGTKRKPHESSMSSVHQKLRKLGLGPHDT